MRKIILVLTVFANLIVIGSCDEQNARIDKIVCQPSEYNDLYDETGVFHESSIHIVLDEVGKRTSVWKMSDYENADNFINDIVSMDNLAVLSDYSTKAVEYDHVCRSVITYAD